jgi:hypothetical protein
MELGDRTLDLGVPPQPQPIKRKFYASRETLTRLGLYQIIFDNGKHILEPLGGTPILEAVRNSRIYARESGEDTWLKFNRCMLRIDLNDDPLLDTYAYYNDWISTNDTI